MCRRRNAFEPLLLRWKDVPSISSRNEMRDVMFAAFVRFARTAEAPRPQGV